MFINLKIRKFTLKPDFTCHDLQRSGVLLTKQTTGAGEGIRLKPLRFHNPGHVCVFPLHRDRPQKKEPL